MSALEVLERDIALDQQLASHAYAERLYERVLELIERTGDPVDVRDAVKQLHLRARSAGEGILRDACVEVLDALDEGFPTAP